ncbi:MAG: translocation/assembly module TamB domain-containing protein [Prevotella sp.]|nr:translocation/assembly module TamB domain-containing protein [Prevotella sp.]
MVGLYAAVVVLLHVPTVQQFVGDKTAQVVVDKLGTDVKVGRVNLGFLNRIIIDDVQIKDQQGNPMLNAARLSAKLDMLALTQGRIVITSAQLFGLRAALYQTAPDSDFNFQFALDSLASKDTTSHTPLDLKISSLIIRRGEVKFDKRFVAPVSGKFSPDHIHATDISAHVMLNALQDDSLNLNVKRLSMKEASGLELKNLQLKATANRQHAELQDFTLELPNSAINIDELTATYRHENGKFLPATLLFEGAIEPSTITLSDIGSLVPTLKERDQQLSLASSFSGTSTSVRINELKIASSDNGVNLHADGSISDWQARPRWNANIHEFNISNDGLRLVEESLPKNTTLPEELTRLGNISFLGTVGGMSSDAAIKGLLNTDAGQAKIALGKSGQAFTGHITTDGVNLKQILDNDKLGLLVTNIDIDGQLSKSGAPSFKAKGEIARIDYNDYTYKNINIDGSYQGNAFDGKLNIDDPNVELALNGRLSTNTKMPAANVVAEVKHLKPAALGISDRWGDSSFDFNIEADLKGSNLRAINGTADINDFLMYSDDNTLSIKNLSLVSESNGRNGKLSVDSDFGHVDLEGAYDYTTIAQSLTNLIGKRLPTLPGLPKLKTTPHNNFAIKANLDDSGWLEQLFDIPLTLHQPLQLDAHITDDNNQILVNASMPDFSYDGKHYQNVNVNVSSPSDTLKTYATVTRVSDNGNSLSLVLNADAANNHLATNIQFNNKSNQPMKGELNADAQFFQTSDHQDAAHVDIHTSEVMIGDTIWNIEPGTIVYSKNDLTIDHLAVKHGKQHIIIDGRGTHTENDTLVAELKEVDVKYILDLVNFHSVEFNGQATGKAYITKLFDKPEAETRLKVNNFRFQDGRMGVLNAHAWLNNELRQIDIDAVANDTGWGFSGENGLDGATLSYTTINGHVSPWRNDIELLIGAHNSRAEFLESFCGSFMDNVNVYLNGDLRLYGPLKQINLTGDAVANGTLDITSLNTSYTLRNDSIHLIPNEIMFQRDTIYDAFEHIGIVNGALHHHDLKNLSYDIGIEAQNLLAYDFRDFGDDTFCGTVYGTGDCMISGRSGEVNIDINVTPEEGSEIRYNVSSPDAISSGEFITWNDRNAVPLNLEEGEQPKPAPAQTEDNSTSDLHLNFVINANQKATLKLIMDQTTGDYIALNGDGVIRATYYNKGSFDMFGNYSVDHGTYKLTIQNVIKKEFQFQPGGTIVFGGDPFESAINLKAVYTVAGVPLSDLNIGRSFTSNNIRVNCLMNITGTAGAPRVEFDLDMPTIGTDAKQMIFSLINSEEEMNQQVLYLLAVGRFYNQGTNNAPVEGAVQQSQTSLAMQSLISGTISQQLNNILSTVVKNQNWNFGASINTGDQGFYNAEYEGLLSGRLLNNRLLINGQFGYRDNPNATTSFIGDFDLRYLLRPNGSLAIKVYNQTNDRYFTKNSLTTQGIGLIIKHDFSSLSDLLKLKRSPSPVVTPTREDTTIVVPSEVSDTTKTGGDKEE